jgi:hypothetical protein
LSSASRRVAAYCKPSSAAEEIVATAGVVVVAKARCERLPLVFACLPLSPLLDPTKGLTDLTKEGTYIHTPASQQLKERE